VRPPRAAQLEHLADPAATLQNGQLAEVQIFALGRQGDCPREGVPRLVESV
jgi:hypothetical protein